MLILVNILRKKVDIKAYFILSLVNLLIIYWFMMIVQFYCDFLYIKYGKDEKILDIIADTLINIDSNKNIKSILNPDYLLVIFIIIYLLTICKLNNRIIIITEISLIISTSFILRMITIISTIIPSSNINCKLFYYDFDKIEIDIVYYGFLRMINLISTCTDKIFSGHIAVAILFLLSWRKYFIHYLYIPLILTILMMIGIIINRNHYTIDITISIILNFLLFKYFERKTI